MYSSIVVGIDGSETARAAMLKAATMAKLTGARIHLVMGSASGRLNELIGVDPLSAGMAGTLRQAEKELAAASEETMKTAAEHLREQGIEVETYLVEDAPADALCNVAESAHADLIIVGNKGMRGTKRFVLGSVPNAVAHHAPCDVTIVQTT